MSMLGSATRGRKVLLALAAGLLGAATLPASIAHANPPTIIGYATNFDVPNGTDKECEGFEVEIEDVTDTQITYTWPGTPSYPNPYGTAKSITNTTFADGHAGVVVRMAADYVGGAWSAHTPIGSVNHYGVHVTGTPGVQRYSWLCDMGGSGVGSTGTLLPYGGTTQGNYYTQPGVPSVVPSVQPTPTGPAVVPVIVPSEPPPPPEARFQDAIWVLKYQASSPNSVDVNQLVASDPEVQSAITHSQISSVAELFQPDPGTTGEETESGDPIGEGDQSSLTVTETFQYTGPVDPVDNSATCNETVGDPNNCNNFVGPMIARQMQSTQLSNPTPRTAVNASVYTTGRLNPIGGNVVSGALPNNADPEVMDCGSDLGSCFVDVDRGTVVDLTGTPDVGYDFQKWTGACTGTNAVCHLTATAVKATKAYFVVSPKLAVGITRRGSVSSSPIGIDCTRGATLSGTCKAPFHKSTVVTLTASPAPGKTFVKWSGACLGVTGPVCNVTITASKTAGAVFSA